MQDEITKHTRKLYDAAKNPAHPWGEKAREILTEIFIIVFAVSLSIWLHGWSEHRQQQREVREFLEDLKADLDSDAKALEEARTELSKSAKSFAFLQALTQARLDSLQNAKAPLNFYSSLSTTKISSGNYEGFKSSGKIGFIENKALKKKILKYYQDVGPNVLEAEKINSAVLLKVLDFWADNADLDINKRILSPKLKTLLATFHDTAKGSLDYYSQAIELTHEIAAEIEGASH